MKRAEVWFQEGDINRKAAMRIRILYPDGYAEYMTLHQLQSLDSVKYFKSNYPSIKCCYSKKGTDLKTVKQRMRKYDKVFLNKATFIGYL